MTGSSLLYREIVSLITIILVGWVAVMLLWRVAGALLARDWGFLATPWGQATTAVGVGAGGVALDTMYVWRVQLSRVTGLPMRHDAPWLWAAYIGLPMLAAGALLMIRAISPLWFSRLWIVAAATTLVVVVIVHLPLIGRVALRF